MSPATAALVVAAAIAGASEKEERGLAVVKLPDIRLL